MQPRQQLRFASRDEFRKWLNEHGSTAAGIWLVFGKKGGPKTLSAQEALEEALCFGWIDGQMKSLDEYTYIKYFAQRRSDSNWSEKNKGLIESLEKQGRMTDRGRAKVEEAKQRGTWDSSGPEPLGEADVASFHALLQDNKMAYSNYAAMSPSIQRTYAAHYFSARAAETRARRLGKIIERLEKNLPPM